MATTTHNIAGEILARAAARPGHAAFAGRDGTVSYAEFAARVEKLADELGRLKLASAVPRIGVLCPDGVRHAVAMLAVMRIGGCAVPVAAELPGAERDALRKTAALHGLLSAVGGGSDAGEGLFWQSLPDPVPAFPVGEFEALDPAFVRFSSGTTGASKGVVLSHTTLRERLDSANRRLCISASDRVLWTLPMAHHFAVSILLYLREGATVVLPEGTFGSDLLAAALGHGATVFYGSPFHAGLLAAEDSGREWASLRLAVSTAAPLPVETAEKFRRRYGKLLVQGLGVIEVGLPLLNTESSDPRVLGRADDFEVRLRDGDTELCVRGPGMFDAYLFPWQPRAAVLRDGWFHTGDMAVLDDNGDVRLVGRLKSVINVGGSKCFPEEIEEVLLGHADVAEVRVEGKDHARWGSLPVAEIVVRAGRTAPAPGELAAYCRTRLASYKVPVQFRFVSALPKTASGKLRRVT